MDLPLPTSTDRASPGTVERLWAQYLQSHSDWEPAEGPLLVVGAQPQAQVLGAGGLIRAWAGMGRPVTVMSVTDSDDMDSDRKSLALRRHAELKEALRVLCASQVSIVRLGVPGGGRSVDWQNRLRNAILSLLEPKLTLIAPYESDGHPAQDLVGKVCVEVAASRKLPLARYPLRIWRRTDPAAFDGARWGKFYLDQEGSRAKAHALQCFAQQRDAVSPDSGDAGAAANRLSQCYEAYLL